MATKNWKDDSGFTPGERLDMAIANGDPVAFLGFGETEDEMQAYEICSHEPKAYIARLGHMAEIDGEHPGIIEDLRKIVNGYDELMNHGGVNGEGAVRHEKFDADLVEKEIELISEIMRDDSEKSFGFFFFGQPTSYGGRVTSGFKGKHQEIIDAMGSWFRQKPRHFIEFMKHMDRVSDDVKKYVVEQGDVGEVIEAMTSALRQSLDRHFNIEKDDKKSS